MPTSITMLENGGDICALIRFVFRKQYKGSCFESNLLLHFRRQFLQECGWNSIIQKEHKTNCIVIKLFFQIRNFNYRNVVYCITCEQCKLQYIGQTTRSLDQRVREFEFEFESGCKKYPFFLICCGKKQSFPDIVIFISAISYIIT